MLTRRPVPAWARRRVKAIDSDLDIVWMAHEDKWAIVQKLYNTPSFEEMLERTARALQETLLEEGFVWGLGECAAAAYTTVAEDCIVFRVEDPDTGEPWPLDDRTFTRLRRLAWIRRNFSLRDHLEASRQMRSQAEAERERAIAGIWDSIKRDKVFERCLSDALWQMRPSRSVPYAPALVAPSGQPALGSSAAGSP